MPETCVTEDVQTAAQALQLGKLVAFPTETVYGLGVDATNSAAVERLFLAKGRPADNPLIVHLADVEDWNLAARELPPVARRLLEAFSPGPLTVVVPKLAAISTLVTAGLDTVGIRVPDHATARELLRICRRPIAAPSANRSGKPSCTTWQAVYEDMNGKIDVILKGDACSVGLESTVVQCTSEQPVVLRSGSISLDQIQTVTPFAISVEDIALASATTLSKASPGTRHAHYQPVANVRLFQSPNQLVPVTPQQRASSAVAMIIAAQQPDYKDTLAGFALIELFDSVDSYARGFYELLREVDRRGLKQVFIELAPSDQLGIALRDRQLRAAGQR